RVGAGRGEPRARAPATPLGGAGASRRAEGGARDRPLSGAPGALLLDRFDDDRLQAAERHLVALEGDALLRFVLHRRVRLGVLVVLEDQVDLLVVGEEAERQPLLGARLGALLVAGTAVLLRVAVRHVTREVDGLARERVGAGGGRPYETHDAGGEHQELSHSNLLPLQQTPTVPTCRPAVSQTRRPARCPVRRAAA